MANYVVFTDFLRNCGWAWLFMEHGDLGIVDRENISSRITTRKDLQELDSQNNKA